MPSLRRGRWLARAKRNTVQYNLGTHDTFEQACIAEANFDTHYPRLINTTHRKREVLTFREELQQLINRHSKENNSNTPDFILAKYLDTVLNVFDNAVAARDSFYGVHLEPGRTHSLPSDRINNPQSSQKP